jgi:cytochrome oxidase Cu insertion factor (SCO1/SenC/PrrC family)
MLRRPQIALLALAAALALALALVVILRGSSGRSASVSEASGTSQFQGAALPAGVPAPDFRLTDQLGRPVSLADYRGRVTVLTFLYSGCGATCVLIAQQIRGAIDELHGTPAVLVVSADPTDTRRRGCGPSGAPTGSPRRAPVQPRFSAPPRCCWWTAVAASACCSASNN